MPDTAIVWFRRDLRELRAAGKSLSTSYRCAAAGAPLRTCK
jgi:hypothetical protein